jgi:hypothetical protein
MTASSAAVRKCGRYFFSYSGVTGDPASQQRQMARPIIFGWARTIAGWTPLPAAAKPVAKPRKRAGKLD